MSNSIHLCAKLMPINIIIKNILFINLIIVYLFIDKEIPRSF